MSDEHLQTFARQAPLSAPDDSKYVQFSLACPPQLIVTANNEQKSVRQRKIPKLSKSSLSQNIYNDYFLPLLTKVGN